MNTEEIWKDIAGYEGLYQISNFGRVRSFNRTRKNRGGRTAVIQGRIVKPNIDRKGYLQFHLYSNSVRRRFYSHQLVAKAFIPNPNNYSEINHKDENPKNNCVWNLEWCNHKYNMNYGTAIERAAKLKRIVQRNNPKISKSVLCIETGVVYPSISEISRELGCSRALIIRCCKGLGKTAYGYHWRYVDEKKED